MVCVGAEVKQSGPSLAGVCPLHPHGYGQFVTSGHFVWQLQPRVAAIQRQRLRFCLVTLGVSGRAVYGRVHHVGRFVVDVVVESPASHHRRRTRCCGLHCVGSLRAVVRKVCGHHLIYICMPLATRIVRKLVALYATAYRVPVVLALFGAQYHVAGQVLLAARSPLQSHRRGVGRGRQSAGLCRSGSVVYRCRGYDAPQLTVASVFTEQSVLVYAHVVDGILRFGGQVERTLAVAQVVATVAGILQIPLLVGRGRVVGVGYHRRLGQAGVVFHVDVAAVVGRSDRVKAVVAANATVHRSHVPRLLGGCRA